MDAFYPSVEVRDNPSLRGRPVIVGGGRERGVVSSASYEARSYGVHSAQPMATAMRLCPEGVFLPVRMERYKEVSRQIFTIFERFTPMVEPLSIDEAFLDVSGSLRLFGRADEIAKKIKEVVLEETGLTVSAGIAPSKFVSKIASDLEKPNGLTIVTPDQVQKFLDPLPVEKMWGVGNSTLKVFRQMGIATFRDLRSVSVKILEKKFGKNGIRMHILSSGIDEREVVTESGPKSIGNEETFAKDITDLEKGEKKLLHLANKIGCRLRRDCLSGRTIVLKVKYSNFVQISRSITLPEATDDGLEIFQNVCRLLESTELGRRPVRLLGIAVSKLDHDCHQDQLALFSDGTSRNKRRHLNKAVDSLIKKHGSKSIQPGTLLSD
jgi:DNA polymerase-4